MRWLKLVPFLLIAVTAYGVYLEQADTIRRDLGISPLYDDLTGIERVKVAVLDIGFGTAEDRRKTLPASIVYQEKYADGKGDPPDGTSHGRYMSQIVWGVAGGMVSNEMRGPRLYLLNANGITNFTSAVDYAIRERVDIILYSQNWEFAGNYDGAGFLNAIVNRATSAGILWVNAAGNYGGRVYNGAASEQEKTLRFTSLTDNNSAKIILTWNSFSSEQNAGTEKDLDLSVETISGGMLKESNLTQVLRKETLGPGETFLPREVVTVSDLRKDQSYIIRIKKKPGSRGTFDAIRDRLRVTVLGERFEDSVRFDDSVRGREIMVPADNPNVITVGDFGPWCAIGPTMDFPGRFKPDIVLEKSFAKFSDGVPTPPSTSNAAAIFAGALARLKAREPRVSFAGLKSHWLQLIPRNRTTEAPRDRARDWVDRAIRYYHASLLLTVETASGGRENVTSALSPGGQFIVEVSEISASLRRFFPTSFRWESFRPEDYELYLRVRRRQVSGTGGSGPRTVYTLAGYSRPTAAIRGVSAPYPWQTGDVREPGARDYREYVQLRVRSGGGGGPEYTVPSEIRERVWRAPTLLELRLLLE